MTASGRRSSKNVHAFGTNSPQFVSCDAGLTRVARCRDEEPRVSAESISSFRARMCDRDQRSFLPGECRGFWRDMRPYWADSAENPEHTHQPVSQLPESDLPSYDVRTGFKGPPRRSLRKVSIFIANGRPRAQTLILGDAVCASAGIGTANSDGRVT